MSLKDLKVGDKVVFNPTSSFSSRTSVATITGITPKGFIKINNGSDLFDPISGWRRGDNGYWKAYITVWSPQAQQTIDYKDSKDEYYSLVSKLYNCDRKKNHSLDFYTKAIGHLKTILAEADVL